MNFPIKDSLVIATTLLTIGIGSMAAPVFAQEEESMEDLEGVLDEVIVTAQRRAENIQDVPISMTVFSEEQLSNANLSNSGDLATITPSLQVETRFGNEMTSFSIRGFYQALRTTASVATYFADVVAPRGQTSQTSGDGAGPGYLFDLQNVQVLKGPQGTLFGRNTTGGAILLVPQEPTDAFEGFVEGTVGNYGQKKLNAVINVPVTETFRARLGVEDNERDGFLDNYLGVGADELGNSDYTATRLSLLWDVTENVENYTIFNYVDSESSGYSSILFACNPNAPSNALLGPSNPATLCADQLERQAAAGNDGYTDIASPIKTPITTIEEKRVINTTTWDVNDDLTIKNIAAYAHLETKNGTVVFGSDFPDPNNAVNGTNYQYGVGISVLNPTEPVTSQATYVEELQFQGTAFDESLTWQTGLYYENSRPDGTSGNNSAAFLFCDFASIEGDPSGFDCYNPAPEGLRNFLDMGSVLVQEFKTEFENQAIYGQATYDFTNEFAVTAGLRYTKDKASGDGIKRRYTWGGVDGRTPNLPLISRQEAEVSSEEPTWLLNATYKFTDDVMAYAKYTRGYRQGSVNLAADPGLDTHEAETIDAYEIGTKTSFDGMFPGQFNIAIFRNELNDAQAQSGYVSKYSGPTTAITNAGEAISQGVEIDSTLGLTDDLSLTVGYTYLDTELKDLGTITEEEITEIVTEGTGDAAAGAQAGLTFVPQSAAGDELPYAPENKWVVSLNYLVPIPADWGVANVGATYIYVDEQRASATGSTPWDMLPDYELLNLNASWMSIAGSNFDGSLFVTNALDEEFVTYIGGTYNALGIEVRQAGMPRMFGARVRYTFGG
jgi:outer membrane receptor protein involved in Fe transport